MNTIHFRFQSLKKIRKRLFSLFRQPVFVFFTVFGNAFVLLGATVFYSVEVGKNTHVESYLDSLAWAVGTVTTIGYGNIVPVTNWGKVTAILMMIGGALFLWSYMALFVGGLVSPEIDTVESEIKEIESDLSELRREIKSDIKSEQMDKLIGEIKSNLEQIKKL